jgi:hypothetical protein
LPGALAQGRQRGADLADRIDSTQAGEPDRDCRRANLVATAVGDLTDEVGAPQAGQIAMHLGARHLHHCGNVLQRQRTAARSQRLQNPCSNDHRLHAAPVGRNRPLSLAFPLFHAIPRPNGRD